MLIFLDNLYRTYRKKLLTHIPYNFDKLRGKKIFKANYYGVPLVMFADTPYQHDILKWMRKGVYEPHILEEWKKSVEGKTCIIDIGGYNGIFGILAGKLNPAAQVFIFEPDEINYRHLARNVELNDLPNVTPVKMAISNKDGETVFGGHEGGTGGKIGKGFRYVQSRRLDSFIRENNLIPDLFKIDVEGAEAMVIEGGEEFFSGTAKPEIFLEVHFEFLKNFNSSQEALFEKLYSFGPFDRQDLEDRRDVTYTVKLQKC